MPRLSVTPEPEVTVRLQKLVDPLLELVRELRAQRVAALKAHTRGVVLDGEG